MLAVKHSYLILKIFNTIYWTGSWEPNSYFYSLSE